MPFDRTEHFTEVLQSHKMDHIADLLAKFTARRDEVKEAIATHYGDSAYSLINSGSYAKHTAINSKFDLDLISPFKRNAFLTLEEMFDHVYDFLYETYSNVATVRKQKVSIGISFLADEDGDIVKIDVVPGRELNLGQYNDDKKLNLYVNTTYGLIEKSSYIQTSISAQIEHIKGKTNERKIIRLLKIWKHSNHRAYKSFLLELLTIKAYNKTEISGELWDSLKGVMRYIQENVAKDGFKLIDPGNSNNDVIDTLTEIERNDLSIEMNNIITRIDENGENAKIYFPFNSSYAKEKKSASYGFSSSIAGSSMPAGSQRFGK